MPDTQDKLSRLERIQAQLTALQKADVTPEVKAQIEELLVLSQLIKGQDTKSPCSAAATTDTSSTSEIAEQEIKRYVVAKSLIDYLMKNKPDGFLFDQSLAGPCLFVASDAGLQMTVTSSALAYTTDFQKEGFAPQFPEELRKELWFRKRRLYVLHAENYAEVEISKESKIETEIASLHAAKAKDQLAALGAIFAHSGLLADKIEKLKDQARRFLSPSIAEEQLLATGLDAAQSIFANLLPAQKQLAASGNVDANPFTAAANLFDLLQSFAASSAPQLTRLFAQSAAKLKSFLEVAPLFEDSKYGSRAPTSLANAANPVGALLSLKLPDPEFNLARIAQDKPTGILSRLPRTSRLHTQQFLINEMKPKGFPAHYIWAVVAFDESIPYDSLDALPKNVLDGIDEFSRREFSTEENIYYLPLKLIARFEKPLELAKPLISRRYGPIVELPSALKKQEIETSDMPSGAIAQAEVEILTCPCCGNDIILISNEDPPSVCPECGCNLHAVNVSKAGPSDKYAPIYPGRGEDLAPLKLDEVLSHFHPEFVLRAPFIHLVGSTVNNGETKHDIDVLIKGPIDPETEHIVKFRLGRMLPGNISSRVQFHGGEQASGPFTAHTALYDLIVRRRDDYASVIEMSAPAAQSTDIQKQDPLMDLPEKGDIAYPSVLQAHFRGKTVHGDFRIKTNGQLIGYTMSIQKVGKVRDVQSVDQAKMIAHSFDPRGSWWNKSVLAPARVFSAIKQLHPNEWLNIEAEGFDPGTVGGTRFKPGFIVAMARPKVTFGTQTPFFHEYFLEGDPKFQGILTFRLVPGTPAQGEADNQGPALSGAFWTGMFTKSLLPSVLKKRALDVGRIPPQGFSALPAAIKAAVPKRFRYWEAADEKERIQIRDALIEEDLFTEKNIRIIDGRIEPVLTKYYTYANQAIEDSAPNPRGVFNHPHQWLPCTSWLAKALSCVQIPTSDSILDLFADHTGGVANCAVTWANFDGSELAEAIAKSRFNARALREARGRYPSIAGRGAFDSAQDDGAPVGLLYRAHLAKSIEGDSSSWEFDASVAGDDSHVWDRWSLAFAQLRKAAILTGSPEEALSQFFSPEETNQFVLIAPPSKDALVAIIPRLSKVRFAKFLVVTKDKPIDLLTASPWLLCLESEGVFYTANYDIEFNTALSSPAPTAIAKALSVPFTLNYQWWRGQIVVRHGPSTALYHLLLQRDGFIEDYQIQQDPLSAEITAAVRREIKTDAPESIMAISGEIPPGDELFNPTKDTPSTIRIIAQGQAKLLEDSPLFKKIEFQGKDLPTGLHGQFILYPEKGSEEMYFLQRVEGEPGSPIDTNPPSTLQSSADNEKGQIKKQEKYASVEFADGSTLQDVQLWDPADMSASDDKTHDRERLRPPVIFRPMKPAPRDCCSFRSNEMLRVFQDFATEAVLKTGISVEPKYNGWRTILEKTPDGKVLILSEDIFGLKTKPANYANYWPAVKAELESIPGPFVIDGEFTAVNEMGNAVPRRELASYRSKAGEQNDDGVRINVFDAYYTPQDGNIMSLPYIKRRQALTKILESGSHLKHILAAPFRVMTNRKDLLTAFQWAKGLPGSEGAMLKSIEHTATLNENDLIAKIKAVREIKGIVYARHPVKDSPGVYNFFYAVGPVSDPELWDEVVEVKNDFYTPMGKTFNVKLDANVGDVIRIEMTEIMYDKTLPGNYKLHGFTPVVIDKTEQAPSTPAEVIAMLEPGEVKKSPLTVRDTIAKALACSDLELTVLAKKKEERYVKGVVLIPNEPDAHGDVYDEETVRDACHHYMEYSEALGKQHMLALSKSKMRILECYLVDADCVIGSKQIKKGTWLLAARVIDDVLWDAIKSGRLTGWSMEGTALAEHLI